jgi:hypothetical protein
LVAGHALIVNPNPARRWAVGTSAVHRCNMRTQFGICRCKTCGPQGRRYSLATCYRHNLRDQVTVSRSASPVEAQDRPGRGRSRSPTDDGRPAIVSDDVSGISSDEQSEASSTSSYYAPPADVLGYGLELGPEPVPDDNQHVPESRDSDDRPITDGDLAEEKQPTVPPVATDISKLKHHQIEALSQPLYDGAPLSVMDAVCDTLQLQADKHLTSAAVDASHDMALRWLPPEARERIMSVRTGRKLLEKLCLPTVQEIHMCPNDCIAFINSPSRPDAQYAALNRCPTCQASRWRKDSPAHANSDLRRPAKVFHYTPLADLVAAHHSITSLQNLRISELRPRRAPDKSRCKSAQETRRWRTKVGSDPSFAAGGRDNMVLQYSTDGIPFFADQNYSGWPMMSMDMCLDPKVRHLPENMLLHGIVPGPNDPKSMDAYHNIFVDDLIAGWTGFELEYPRKMKCRVLLLNVVCDYPGLCKCCNRGSNSGHKPCVVCGQTAEHVEELQRSVMTAIGDDEPAIRTMADCERTGSAIEALIRQRDEKGAKDLKTTTGIRCTCPFARVPGFDTCKDFCLDLMHVAFGIIKSHVFALMKGSRLPKMPTDPRIRYKWGPQCRDNRPRSCVLDLTTLRGSRQQKAKRIAKYKVKWEKEVATREAKVEKWRDVCTRTTDHQRKAQALTIPERTRRVIDQTYVDTRAPSGVIPGGKSPFRNSHKLKSHDWLTLTKWLAPHLFSGMLGDVPETRKTLVDLCLLLADMCKPSLDCSTQACQARHQHVREVMQRVEAVLPWTERSIVFHLVLHLPRQQFFHGPLRLCWMYPYERFVGWVKRLTQSRKHPEAAMARMAMQLMYTRILRDRYPSLSHPDRIAQRKAATAATENLPGRSIVPNKRPQYTVPSTSSNSTRRARQCVEFSRDHRRALSQLLRSPIEPTAKVVRSVIHAGGADGRTKRTSWASEVTRFTTGVKAGRGTSSHSITFCHADGADMPAVPCYIVRFLHVTFKSASNSPELIAQVRVMRPLRTTPLGVTVVRFPVSGEGDSSDIGRTSYLRAQDLGVLAGLSPVPGFPDQRAVITNMGE